jgi:hypothetical protein
LPRVPGGFDNAEIGERVRLLELATGLNGAEMSRLLGVPTQTWSSWKIGQARIPVHVAALLASNMRL